MTETEKTLRTLLRTLLAENDRLQATLAESDKRVAELTGRALEAIRRAESWKDWDMEDTRAQLLADASEDVIDALRGDP